MQPTSKILLMGALSLASASAFAQSLLPLPQQVAMGKGVFRTATLPKVGNGVGQAANNIYVPEWGWRGNAGGRQVVSYRPLSGAASPEAYRLRVTPDSLVVSAASRDGFLRAWQTIRQLTDARGDVACCDISDAPAYRWRGVMLDVSRHFFPISHIRKQIDILARYKVNRLHLHLTDAAGWRIEIKRYPRLTNFAAWRPQARWKDWNAHGNRYCPEDSAGAYGGYYTQDELRSLVAYAADRGITIVPEIEMPGHSEEVLTAYPELSCTHQPYHQSDFCPGSVATYDFLENVLTEVMDIFPSHYIHVGGDEAGKQSWPGCPLCQKKMKELGLKDVNGLQAYLITRIGKFLNAHGRQLVGWDEIIDGDLAPGTTVMVWRGTEKAHEAIKHGYDVVLSPGAYCYLDNYQDDPHAQPEAIGGYLPLEKVYSYVPGGDLPAGERSHVVGVQANVWAEYIPTPEHQELMLYPRSLAIAEIGWNGTAKKDYAGFRRRALQQVELLKAAGAHPFDLAREVGNRKESQRPVAHKAVGATVTYNKPYSDYYKAAGATTLTDGKMGGWANNDGFWQGFIGPDCFDVTIDLGSVQPVKSVSTDFMQSCGPEIYYPSAYKVSVSEDGKAFTTVADQSFESKKTDLTETKLYAWRGNARARYVRVQARPSSFGGWLFADEVIVK